MEGIEAGGALIVIMAWVFGGLVLAACIELARWIWRKVRMVLPLRRLPQ
jgi:hypothetical protein